MQQGQDEITIRSIIFITLLFSNIFLTLVNRSFYFSIFTTLKYKNNLVLLIVGVTLLFVVAILYVPFVRDLFRLNLLSFTTIGICILVSMISTLWLEVWKFKKRSVGKK
jgi:Ca2+-transporting ATPase